MMMPMRIPVNLRSLSVFASDATKADVLDYLRWLNREVATCEAWLKDCEVANTPTEDETPKEPITREYVLDYLMDHLKNIKPKGATFAELSAASGASQTTIRLIANTYDNFVVDKSEVPHKVKLK
jgi:hypothetical protein